MPPAIRSAEAPSDSPMANPMKQESGVVGGNEQQNAEHQEQLDADEQHPDAHAGLERNGVNRKRLAPQAGERGPGVGEGVDADAEPGHAVAAGDADQAENEDDGDLDRREVPQHAEVEDHDHADEQLEQQDELPLRDQIRLARFVNELGHLEHRRMHRQVLELREDGQAEQQAQRADDQAAHQQRAPVDAAEVDRRQVRQHQVRFAARFLRDSRGGGCGRLRQQRPRSVAEAAIAASSRIGTTDRPSHLCTNRVISPRTKARIIASAGAAAPCRLSGRS